MDSPAHQELLEAIRQADRVEANRIIDAWAGTRSLEAAVTELMAPVMEHFGREWAAGGVETSLAQGYVASKIAEDVLGRILEQRALRAEAPPWRGPVILGNIEDDYHPLGRRMVASFLRFDGWQVVDLGVDVPPEAFLSAIAEHQAKVVGVSAMMFSTAKNVARLRRALDAQGLTGRVQLAVGGAVFKLRPELVQEVGGDGTAPTAIHASALMADLLARAEAQA